MFGFVMKLTILFLFSFSAISFADEKDCLSSGNSQYKEVDFNALVSNIQLGFTSLNNNVIYTCIVHFTNLDSDKNEEVELLPSLTTPEESMTLCNYMYNIYKVDRPVYVKSCQDLSSKKNYLRLVSFTN